MFINSRYTASKMAEVEPRLRRFHRSNTFVPCARAGHGRRS